MLLQFVIGVDVGPEEVITEGEKPKEACSENHSEPNCEWACHVPPSLWWRDVRIWTDSGLKPTRLPRLCNADGYLALSTIVLFRRDPTKELL